MNAQSIAEFIRNPENLDKKSYNELKSLLDTFPYFQTAHLLMLRNAKNVKIVSLDKIVEKSSAFVNDRTKLFDILNENVKPEAAIRPQVREQEPSRITRTEKREVTENISETEKSNIQETTVVPRSMFDKTERTEEKLPEPKSENAEVNKSENIVPVNEEVVTQATVKTVEILTPENPVVAELTETNKEPQVVNSEIARAQKKHETLVNDIIKPKIETEFQNNNKTLQNQEPEQKTEVKEEIVLDKQALTEDIFRKIANIERSTSGNKPPTESIIKREPVKTETSLEIKTEDVITSETPTVREETATVETTVSETEIHREPVIIVETNEEVAEIIIENTNATEEDVIVSEFTETEIQTFETETSSITVSEATNTEISAVTLENDSKTEEITTITITETTSMTVTFENIEENSELPSINEQSPEQLLNIASTEEPEIIIEESIEEPAKEKSAADMLMERIAAMRTKKPEPNTLIDSFLKIDPKLDAKKEISLDGDISEDSVREKDPIVTELMASIYINQGHYDKAIDVFEKLILKYPEKKDYFAVKIQETQELKN